MPFYLAYCWTCVCKKLPTACGERVGSRPHNLTARPSALNLDLTSLPCATCFHWPAELRTVEPLNIHSSLSLYWPSSGKALDELNIPRHRVKLDQVSIFFLPRIGVFTFRLTFYSAIKATQQDASCLTTCWRLLMKKRRLWTYLMVAIGKHGYCLPPWHWMLPFGGHNLFHKKEQLLRSVPSTDLSGRTSLHLGESIEYLPPECSFFSYSVVSLFQLTPVMVNK